MPGQVDPSDNHAFPFLSTMESAFTDHWGTIERGFFEGHKNRIPFIEEIHPVKRGGVVKGKRKYPTFLSKTFEGKKVEKRRVIHGLKGEFFGSQGCSAKKKGF